ncbi:unnamed protein product [Allacma fusca]|uniref:carbonic anhydrase n=1 Tax=Allacma fusca TaxID=39272 RepID=A0A8J2L3H6_9HEXA|nr:unnamed protein product [Allacma fusca]
MEKIEAQLQPLPFRSRRSKRKWSLLLLLWCTLSLKLSGVRAVLYKPEETDDVDESVLDTVASPHHFQTKTATPPPTSCNATKSVQLSDLNLEVCVDKDKMFLIFDPFDENDLYPPWTYHGFNGPTEWHKIDPRLFNTDSKYSGLSMIQKYPPNGNVSTSLSSLDNAKSNDESKEYYGFVPSFMRFNGYLLDNFCDGQMPSPIVINPENAKLKDTLSEFEYTHMDESYAIQMYFPEDGTNLLTVRAMDAWELSKAPCISKGSVTGPDLCLDRFIIHYGVDGKTGSEHRLGNKTFGMEFQFFFTLQKTKTRSASEFFYTYLNEYLYETGNSTKGEQLKGKMVRALAVFVEVVDGIETEPNMRILAELAKLFWASSNHNKLRTIQTKQKVFRFQPFFPVSLYYTYKGSLTFPPCFPDLDWTVFETPIKISRKDYESFLFIPSEFDETGYVAGNFRSIESIYVQFEDPLVNKDEEERNRGKEARENREIFKSLAPHDTTKEALYDYYDTVSDSSVTLLPSVLTGILSYTLLFPFQYIKFLL